LGSGLRQSIRLREVAPYYRRARAAFEEAARNGYPTSPYPCEHCTFCAYRGECTAGWRAEDHLSLVASIRRDQVGLLGAAGIGSRGALAALPTGGAVADLRAATRAGLQQQARLQVAADSMPTPPYELLPPDPERG